MRVQRSKARVTAVCAVVAGVALSCLAGASEAQPEVKARKGFAVGPLALEVAARPGQEHLTGFSIVTYEVEERQRFSIAVRDAQQKQFHGVGAAPAGEGVRSCANWITVQESLVLSGNDRREVPVAVRCPSDARGAYYALIEVMRGLLVGDRRLQSEFEVRIPADLTEAVVGRHIGDEAFRLALEVEPTQMDLTLPPGARRTVAVRVRNPGQREVHITARPALVRSEPDGLLTYAAKWEPGREHWVVVRRGEFTLGPGRSTTVPAQVVIPRDRPERGTVACALLLKARAVTGADEDEAASVGEYPVLIFARDPKAPPARLESLGMQLVRASPESNPRSAVLRVRNVGGRVGQISGRMVLHAATAGELASLAIGQDLGEMILPGAEREFRLPLPFLDKGDYTVRARVSAGRAGEGVLEQAEPFTVSLAVPEGIRAQGAEEPR